MPLQRLDDFNVLDTDTGVVSYIPVTNGGRAAPGAPTSGPGQVGDELLYPTRKMMPSPGSLPTSDLPASPDRQLDPLSGGPAFAPGETPVSPVLASEPDRQVDPVTGAPVAPTPSQPPKRAGLPVPQFGPKDELYQGMSDDAARVLDAQGKAGEAQIAHDAALAGNAASGLEQEAALTNQYQADSFNSRRTAQAKAEARWDMFDRDMKEKLDQKVDPSHWFSSRSIWQKVVATLSVAAGSLITGGGKNPGLDIINQYIRDDIAAQRDNIQTGIAGLRMKEGIVERKNANDLQGIENDAKDYLTRLEAIRKEVLARGNRLDQSSGAWAKNQQLYADLGAKGLDMANAIRGFQMTDEDTKANRNFQDEQRRKAELFQSGQRRAAEAHDREMAAAKKGPDGPAWAPEEAIAADQFVVTDASGKEVDLGTAGVPFAHKDSRQKVADRISGAQATTDGLEEFLWQIDNNSSLWDDAAGNTEREAAFESAIQSAVRTNERGAPSDQDKQRFETIIRGWKGDWLKGRIKPGDARKIVERRLVNESDQTNAFVNAHKDPRITGAKVSWRKRPYQHLDDAAAPSNDERLAADIGRAPGAIDTRTPKTPEQIAAGKKNETYKAPGAKEAFESVEDLGRLADQKDPEALATLREYAKNFKGTEYTPTGKPGDRVNVGRLAAARVHRAEAQAAYDSLHERAANAAIGEAFDITGDGPREDDEKIEFRGQLRTLKELRKIIDTDTEVIGPQKVVKASK